MTNNDNDKDFFASLRLNSYDVGGWGGGFDDDDKGKGNGNFILWDQQREEEERELLKRAFTKEKEEEAKEKLKYPETITDRSELINDWGGITELGRMLAADKDKFKEFVEKSPMPLTSKREFFFAVKGMMTDADKMPVIGALSLAAVMARKAEEERVNTI